MRAMTRRPDGYHGAGTPVKGDVGDPASLALALDGRDAAYSSVSPMETPGSDTGSSALSGG